MRERLDNWCGRGVVLLLLVSLAFAALATGAVRSIDFAVVEFLVIPAAVLWLAHLWLSPSSRLLWPPIVGIVLAFIVYAVIRYGQCEVEYPARQELARVLLYGLIFFLALSGFRHQRDSERVVYGLVFLGMGISMYAVYQFLTQSDRVWHFIKPVQYLGRSSGTFICPNHLAGFLELLLPAGFAFLFMGRPGHVVRILLGYASLVMLAGMGATVSRGGWLACGLALLLFVGLVLRKPRLRIPAILLLAALLLAGIRVTYQTSPASQRWRQALAPDNPHESANLRLLLWKRAAAMWLDHPWLGVGPAQFDYRFPRYRPALLQARPGYVHNDFLNTLVDWGVVGFVLVAAAWLLLFHGVRKTWRFVERGRQALGSQQSQRAAMLCGASLGLLALLIHSGFDFNFHIPANAMVAITFMGLASAQLRFSTDRYWRRVAWPARLVLTLLTVAACLYLGRQAWRATRESSALAKAARAKPLSSGRLEALKEAAATEPMNPETPAEIGEILRQWSWRGEADYETLAREAMDWFARSQRLNPFDPYNPMRIGMCLDWLGRRDEAAPHFERAVALDPNNYYVVAHMGWHLVQVGDYAAAKEWFNKSLLLQDAPRNPIALAYLGIVENKLKEQAAP